VRHPFIIDFDPDPDPDFDFGSDRGD